MAENLSVDEWNSATVGLVQACLGSITENVRMILLDRKKNSWIGIFYLEKNEVDDVEEIEDIRLEFMATDDKNEGFQAEIVICNGDLPVPVYPCRAVFLKHTKRSS